jgi:hypothetical protein
MRIFVECALAGHGAEVEGVAIMFRPQGRRFLVHHHSADWVFHHCHRNPHQIPSYIKIRLYERKGFKHGME